MFKRVFFFSKVRKVHITPSIAKGAITAKASEIYEYQG